jgi:hypothetical protein
MGYRLLGALLLAGLLGGCAETTDFFTPAPRTPDYAMAPPDSTVIPSQGDPSFRYGELRAGMTKAQLEAMYPGRLAFDSSDSRSALYFVEPLGLAPRSIVDRERLVLWLTDGRLATFNVVRSSEPVAVANVSSPSRAMTTGSIAAPRRAAERAAPARGQLSVQIAASRSEADARVLIDAMRAKYPGQLAKLSASIAKVSLPDGVFYRVLIGPLGSEQASQLCSSLKAQGAECFLRAV